ncbi:MAG: hypothetical protein LAP21_03290 [Acidobacteriia bacterium]|nr:hypothetical protein [Terriglobia bacterium]
MKCEQFLFEASYLLESGDCEEPGRDALGHLRECASCRAQWNRFRNELHSVESEAPLLMSERLHQTIDMMIAEKAARLERPATFGRMWLQMSVALIVLVASIAGITYQSHPTDTTPVYARR